MIKMPTLEKFPSLSFIKATFELMVRTVTLFGIMMVLFAGHVPAAEISGVAFNDRYQDGGVTMSLQGVGKKNVVFFKAFVAAFYRAETTDNDVLGEFPKRIEVEYFVKIPAIKLNNFTLDRMKDNINEKQLSNIEREIDLMQQYFVDLKPGDRFSLTYLPGVGTKFAHNGGVTGIIEGDDFARALFSVWLGENPFDNKLKMQILGLEKEGLSEGNDLVRLSEK